MTAKLQNYFPVIRTREEILAEIYAKEELRQIFECWQEENQQEFLDFCTGVKGVKVMYDFISKAVLDPSATPERMDELLSLLLGQKVKVKEVLPNEGAAGGCIYIGSNGYGSRVGGWQYCESGNTEDWI